MKLKTSISIIALIAIMQFINPVAPAVSDSDHLLPGKVEGSPQYMDFKLKLGAKGIQLFHNLRKLARPSSVHAMGDARCIRQGVF
jgi:hypothetical protein